jgi:hypothetical protein
MHLNPVKRGLATSKRLALEQHLFLRQTATQFGAD